MKKNLVLLMLCAFGLSTMAQNPLVGVDHSVYTDDASLTDVWGYGVPTGYPAGHKTFRVYGYLVDGTARMQSVIGVPGGLESYIGTDEPDGYLWNYPAPIGQSTGTSIPSGFIPFGGDGGTAMYDSYVTIGAENDDAINGVTGFFGSVTGLTFGIGTSNVPAATFWGTTTYADIANPDFVMTNEAWLLGDVSGQNALGVGPDFQVLLAQLTTTADDIHYGLNLTALTDLPLSGGETWITYWDPSGLGGTSLNEADGSALGFVYPVAATPGCTDSNACNFDSTATEDDGSCDLGDWYIPLCPSDGPAVQSCDGLGLVDYVLADQACAQSTIDGDSFCSDNNFDGVCFDAYVACTGDVLGCTDAGACNFDSAATLDDCSCEFTSCAGCTDSTACNFDSTATIEDGSCDFTSCLEGCTNSLAINFDSTAFVDDGSCIVPDCAPDPAVNFTYCYDNGLVNESVFVFQSTNPGVSNVLITFLAGTLESSSFDQLTIYDGADNTAPVLYSNAGDGTQELDGLTVESTGDFMFIELSSDGSVSCATTASYIPWSIDVYCAAEIVSGCTDSTACNFDSTAAVDDGSCEFDSCAGCTDSLACNFDSTATIDDPASCCFDNCITLTVDGGGFPEEVSWDLVDAGGAIVASGGAPFDGVLCLTDGCYSFNMFDSFGDGWNGNAYEFSDDTGVIASGDLDTAVIGDGSDFDGTNDLNGTDFVDVGGTGTCPVFGCTDPTACNFDSNATDDDGSCASDNDAPGCTVEVVPVSEPGVCNSIAVDLTGATNAAASINSGADRWYSFVAVSSVVSVQLTNVTGSSADPIVGLYDSSEALLASEDVTLTDGDEILNFAGLTVGETYLVGVEDWNEDPSDMTADLCIVQFPDSNCDLPPSLAAGPFTIQSQLKADYNANAVGYTLTMTSTTTGLSYTSPVQGGTWIYIVLSGAPNTPDNYDVTLSAIYEVANGNGTIETLSAGSGCNVDVGQFDTFLVAAHTCDNKTWPLSGRPKAAPPQVNAGSFTWEFTQVTPTPGAAWEYTTPDGNRKLPAGGLGAIVGDDGTSMIMEGATYDVRIRANYDSGSVSDFGPTECLAVQGVSGGNAANTPEEDGTFAEAAKSVADLFGEDMGIYPNPTNVGFFNLNIANVTDSKVSVDIVDLQGRVVQAEQISADVDAPFNQQITLDNLSTGNYLVNVTMGGTRTTMSLVVTR